MTTISTATLFASPISDAPEVPSSDTKDPSPTTIAREVRDELIASAIRDGRYNPGSTYHLCARCKQKVTAVAMLTKSAALCFDCERRVAR